VSAYRSTAIRTLLLVKIQSMLVRIFNGDGTPALAVVSNNTSSVCQASSGTKLVVDANVNHMLAQVASTGTDARVPVNVTPKNATTRLNTGRNLGASAEKSP